MKTIKLLALLAVLAVAGLANAQTLTRSLVLKPAGETNALTLTSSTPIGTAYSINLPGGGSAAATGPFVKTTTGAGSKTWSFGQVNLTSNGAAGDITGTLGVTNGGTGLNNAPINSILYASAADVYSSLSPGTTGQVLGNNAGVPTWGTTLGGGGAVTTNISNTGAGNTTNINGPTATGGSVVIGNATSTNSIVGTTTFTGTVNIPLTTDYIWRGVAGVSTPYAPGTAGQILAIVGTTPTWSTTLGGGGATTNISNSGAGNTTNINNSSTGGTVNLGNATSTTNVLGTLDLTGATVSLTLADQNIWVGNGSNVATPKAPVANSILTTDNSGTPVVDWRTTLPSGLTIPGATITTPTITGGTISGTPISGSTGSFTTLTSSGNTTLGTGAGSTNTFGNATGSSTMNGSYTFGAAAGNVVFTNMPSLPLTTNNMYVGVGNVAAELTTVTDRVLTSPAGVPTWSTYGSLLSGATIAYTCIALDATNGYASINTTTVPTLISTYGYTLTAKVIITYESATGPAQVAMVGDRDLVVPANGFRVYSGAMSTGDKIYIVIIP